MRKVIALNVEDHASVALFYIQLILHIITAKRGIMAYGNLNQSFPGARPDRLSSTYAFAIGFPRNTRHTSPLHTSLCSYHSLLLHLLTRRSVCPPEEQVSLLRY